MVSTDMDQQLLRIDGGGSPARGSTWSRNSSGVTAGLTCGNPMAARSRASCLWKRSSLIDAAILTAAPAFLADGGELGELFGGRE